MRSYAVTDYAVLFRELAIPRLVGTPNHQRVREILKHELIARGFSVEEHVFSGRPARALVGVIFPDAEEYGLVGARTLAVERGEVFAQSSVINLDSLDDNGRATAFVHRPGRVGAAVAQAVNARRWRWLPVIVDGIALGRVAKECVTIMKGNWRTMRVVHRPQDSIARLRLDGAAHVAAGLARVLRAG